MVTHKIAVIGLGYVGLPLAVAFSKQYRVKCFDINIKRIKELNAGRDHTQEVTTEDLSALLKDFCNADSSNGIFFSEDEIGRAHV